MSKSVKLRPSSAPSKGKRAKLKAELALEKELSQLAAAVEPDFRANSPNPGISVTVEDTLNALKYAQSLPYVHGDRKTVDGSYQQQSHAHEVEPAIRQTGVHSIANVTGMNGLKLPSPMMQMTPTSVIDSVRNGYDSSLEQVAAIIDEMFHDAKEFRDQQVVHHQRLQQQQQQQRPIVVDSAVVSSSSHNLRPPIAQLQSSITGSAINIIGSPTKSHDVVRKALEFWTIFKSIVKDSTNNHQQHQQLITSTHNQQQQAQQHAEKIAATMTAHERQAKEWSQSFLDLRLRYEQESKNWKTTKLKQEFQLHQQEVKMETDKHVIKCLQAEKIAQQRQIETLKRELAASAQLETLYMRKAQTIITKEKISMNHREICMNQMSSEVGELNYWKSEAQYLDFYLTEAQSRLKQAEFDIKRLSKKLAFYTSRWQSRYNSRLYVIEAKDETERDQAVNNAVAVGDGDKTAAVSTTATVGDKSSNVEDSAKIVTPVSIVDEKYNQQRSLPSSERKKSISATIEPAQRPRTAPSSRFGSRNGLQQYAAPSTPSYRRLSVSKERAVNSDVATSAAATTAVSSSFVPLESEQVISYYDLSRAVSAPTAAAAAAVEVESKAEAAIQRAQNAAAILKQQNSNLKDKVCQLSHKLAYARAFPLISATILLPSATSEEPMVAHKMASAAKSRSRPKSAGAIQSSTYRISSIRDESGRIDPFFYDTQNMNYAAGQMVTDDAITTTMAPSTAASTAVTVSAAATVTVKSAAARDTSDEAGVLASTNELSYDEYQGHRNDPLDVMHAQQEADDEAARRLRREEIFSYNQQRRASMRQQPQQQHLLHHSSTLPYSYYKTDACSEEEIAYIRRTKSFASRP